MKFQKYLWTISGATPLRTPNLSSALNNKNTNLNDKYHHTTPLQHLPFFFHVFHSIWVISYNKFDSSFASKTIFHVIY